MASKRFRPAIPDRVKLIAVLRHLGLTTADVEFDHCPPLGLREYDEAARIYTPPANDPEKIVMRLKAAHRAKTSHPLGPHTSLGGDQHLIAKTRHGRDTKFAVVKPDLAAPLPRAESRPAPERCRTCGHEPELCICPKREKRPAFQRAR